MLDNSEMNKRFIFKKRLAEDIQGTLSLMSNRDHYDEVVARVWYPLQTIKSKYSLQKAEIIQKARQQEIDVLNLIKANKMNNIVDIYEVHESPDDSFAIMEYSSEGDLFDFIRQKGPFSEQTACQLFQQLLHGVENLHNVGIIHRDLKPENILLFRDENHELQLKICNFNCAKILSRDDIYEAKRVGSLAYSSPEALEHRYSLESDIWSLGCILFALLTAEDPFDPQHFYIFEKIQTQEFSFQNQYWSNIHLSCMNLVSRMIAPLDERISLKEISTHNWFQNMKQKETIVPSSRQITNIKIEEFILVVLLFLSSLPTWLLWRIIMSSLSFILILFNGLIYHYSCNITQTRE